MWLTDENQNDNDLDFAAVKSKGLERSEKRREAISFSLSRIHLIAPSRTLTAQDRYKSATTPPSKGTSMYLSP